LKEMEANEQTASRFGGALGCLKAVLRRGRIAEYTISRTENYS